MDNHNILSFLGLAKRAGKLAVGEEPAEGAARAKDARVLFLAADAADNTRRRCEHFAEAGNCLWLRLPFTKEELGRAVGRTSVAILAVTDIGFAAAMADRLAKSDSKRYGEAAEKLALKARRAAQRKAEMLAHEKNLRQGRRTAHPAKDETPPEKPPEPPTAPSAPRPAGPASRRPGAGRPPSGPYRRPGDRGPYRKPSGTAGTSGASGEKPDVPHKSRPFGGGHSRPAGDVRSRPKANPYAHSKPVKKGKGSFRKKES